MNFVKRNLQLSCATDLPLSGMASYRWPMASLRRGADPSTCSGQAHNDNYMSNNKYKFDIRNIHTRSHAQGKPK